MVSAPAVKSNRPATSGRRRTETKQAPASRGHKRTGDVRKEQNKNASRLYRERRKQRLALLEQLLEKEKTQKDSLDASQTTANPSQNEDVPETSIPNTLAVSHTQPVFQNLTLEQAGCDPAINFASSVSEDLALNNPWLMPQNDLPFGMAFEQPNDYQDKMTLPDFSPQWSVLGHEVLGTKYPPIDEPSSAPQLASSVFATGPSSTLTLAHKSAPSARNQEQEQRDEGLQSFFNTLMSLSVPDVKQVIYVQQNGLFGAVLKNTLALGLIKGAEMLFSQDGTSPFNRDWVESKGAMQLSAIKAKFAATPRDLQPVDIQITFEHHVYLDVLPFPLFRDKALKALTCEPPLFDEDELCIDITVNTGLVVWGSQGNDQGMEACRPWDMRSWEPKPWFLKKYWYLCGGWEDEMWKAARWWHAMRNERIVISPPDPPTSLENVHQRLQFPSR